MKSISSKILSAKFADNYGLYVVLGLIFGLQIVMLVPLSLGLVTTPFSITFRATILTVALFLILRNVSLPSTVKIYKGYAYFLIFWIIYSIRLFYDLSIVEIPISRRLQSAQFIYLYCIGSTFIPIIALAGLLKKKSINQISAAIFWISLIQVVSIVFIFFQLYGLTIEAFLSRHIVSQAMSESEVGQPINVIIISRTGGLLAVLAILFTPQNFILKLVKFSAFILGVAVLILGASRGPFVAFVCSLLFMLFYKAITMKKNLKWFFFIGLFMLLMASLILAVNLNPEIFEISLFDRFSTLLSSNKNLKGEERYMEWYAAWEQFLSSPIIGDQIVTSSKHTYPHNLFLEVLMATGLIGFIPFVLSVFYTFKKGLKMVKYGYPQIFHLFLFSFISMIFSGAIFLSPEFWVTMILVLGVSIPKHKLIS